MLPLVVVAELGILPHAWPLVTPHIERYPSSSRDIPRVLWLSFQTQIQPHEPGVLPHRAHGSLCTRCVCALGHPGASTNCPVNSNPQLGPSQQQTPGLGAEGDQIKPLAEGCESPKQPCKDQARKTRTLLS